MPRFLQPKKSTQHRVAAIALYRALLSRCSSAPLPDDDRVSLRNAIRNKFRRNRKIQSPYQLGLSFKAGYQTLDHLDASATGDATSTSILTRLVSQLPCALTRILPIKPRRETPPDPLKERLARLPPEKAVLNVRPYAQTSGPRHVPILASANSIPFLRLTKPQPPALSQVLHQRLERKTELFDTMVLLDNWWLPICQQEDKWDVLMNEQLKKREDTVRWTDAVRLSQSENREAYEKDLKKDRQITRKMQRIVDMETELALKEGQTIVRGRRRHPIRVIKPES
ncbi:DNA repair protein [Alternaria alternata]|nr:DNA repair protein [Alternaria alternata]